MLAGLAARAGRLVPGIRRLRAHVSGRAGPAPPLADLGALESGTPLDVCVIGSGPAGTVVGLDLARRGWRVLILESGPPRGRRVAGGVDRYRDSGEVKYPFVSSQYRGFGGASTLWHGACPRLRPIDFQRNAYTPPTAAWPIGYEDLEPYYVRAEETLSVRRERPIGDGATRGALADDPSWTDRGVPSSVLERVGVIVESPPVARRPGGGDCYRVGRDLLPAFSALGQHALIGAGTATELLHGHDGSVSGVQVDGRDGTRRRVRARIYVVACGGLETPRLLLMSRSRSCPDGLGNCGGVVGRFFMEHLHLEFHGAVAPPVSARGRSFQFYEAFKQRGLGSPILSVRPQPVGRRGVLTIAADIEMYPSESNRLALAGDRLDRLGRPEAGLSLSLADRDRETLREVDALIRGIFARLGGAAALPVPGHHGAVSWLYHHMGTCRMGDDQASSVTDRNLRVHGSANLYLAGSAVFVTGGGANPTLTIVALSHRLADHLHERLSARP